MGWFGHEACHYRGVVWWGGVSVAMAARRRHAIRRYQGVDVECRRTMRIALVPGGALRPHRAQPGPGSPVWGQFHDRWQVFPCSMRSLW